LIGFVSDIGDAVAFSHAIQGDRPMVTDSLTLNSYDDAIAHIRHLASIDYHRKGNWDLGQMCYHLAYYYRGSLDGFDFVLPWFIRKTFGKKILQKILSGERVASKRTIPKSEPPDDIDRDAAISDAIDLLERLKKHTGKLHPSPLFGDLTGPQWQQLHLVHTEGHLSMLVPSS